MYKCKQCEKEFEEYGTLALHRGRIHKIMSEQTYIDYKLNGKHPICKCGCKNKTKWSYTLKGFRDYCQGHQSRVKNNWGHNNKAINNSSKTRREQYASGDRKVWNDGLTKETDCRVELNGAATSEAFTRERKKRYSGIMKKNRLNGIVPTLYGKDHSQWKGGVSEINVIARSDKRLYVEWKYPILVRDGFKCVKCGDSKDLHIHHDKEPMCEIVQKHMPDAETIVDFEFKKLVASKIVDYHVNEEVSGITLCKGCHNKLHPSLNF
jgi:hypothetical protein